MVKVAASLVGVAFVLGCSTFTPPKAKPVIEDRVSVHKTSSVGVLATTPERRVVVVLMPDQLLCAEPSADVAESISSVLDGMVTASAKGKITEAEAGLANSLATTARQLFVRSQGVQLYRDTSFVLCNAYLNKVISPEQFVDLHGKALDVASKLISQEIPELHRYKYDNPSQAIAPAVTRGRETTAPSKSPGSASPEEVPQTPNPEKLSDDPDPNAVSTP